MDILESIVYSWAKHIKQFPVVQMNWKYSPCWEPNDERKAQELLSRTRERFLKEKGLALYGNSRFDQILKQGECDVVGMKLEGAENNVLFAEVAFHEAGLDYGNKNKPDWQVVTEKLLKNALYALCFFRSRMGELLFITPKVSAGKEKETEDCIDLLSGITRRYGFNYHFRLIANQSFQEEIVLPLKDNAEIIHDSEDVFFRALGLLEQGNRKEVI